MMTKKQKQFAMQCKWKSEKKDVKWKRNRYLGRRRYIKYKPLHKLRQRIKLKIPFCLFFFCRFSTLTKEKKMRFSFFGRFYLVVVSIGHFAHFTICEDCSIVCKPICLDLVNSHFFLQSQQNFFCSLSRISLIAPAISFAISVKNLNRARLEMRRRKKKHIKFNFESFIRFFLFLRETAALHREWNRSFEWVFATFFISFLLNVSRVPRPRLI